MRAHLIFTVLTVLTFLTLGVDTARVICFGADGHVAVERMTSGEHKGEVAMIVDGKILVTSATLPPAGERMHLDINPDVGGPSSTTPMVVTATATSFGDVAAGLNSISAPPFLARVAGPAAVVEAALRSTVLRI
jgi:hypothetical protein